MQQQIYVDKKLEILAALKHLNEQLSPAESEFLNAHSTNNALMNQFALAGTMEDGGKYGIFDNVSFTGPHYIRIPVLFLIWIRKCVD